MPNDYDELSSTDPVPECADKTSDHEKLFGMGIESNDVATHLNRTAHFQRLRCWLGWHWWLNVEDAGLPGNVICGWCYTRRSWPI